MNVLDILIPLSNKISGDFTHKLIPTIDRELFLGIKAPILRQVAKDLFKSGEYISFINDLPHKYFEENLLHSFLLEQIKDYDEFIIYLERFLPYIDNWCVCDTMSPKCIKKNKDKFIIKVKQWIKSDEPYTVRFALSCLMSYYLDDDFDPSYLKLASLVSSKHYYVKMMVAWYFATALAKQYDSSIKYIENRLLDKWVHNKTIQKAKESYRVSDEHKAYLVSLRVKN